MLEAHATKQQLHATRKELSHALYQHDAACRVIARLTDERDDAQKLVADLKYSLADQNASKEVPSSKPSRSTKELDPEVTTHMTEFWKETSRSRKKRLACKQLNTVESIASWSRIKPMEPFSSELGARDVSICQQSGSIVICGGKPGVVWLKGPESQAIAHESIADTCAMIPRGGSSPGTVFATSGADAVTIWRAERGVIEAVAAVEVRGVASVAAHPTGSYIAAMRNNASWTLMALGMGTSVLRELTSTSTIHSSEFVSAPLKFHPDGLILATPTTSSHGHIIRIWDVKEQKHVHSFEGHSAPISCVAFSENGYYMASSSADATTKIWDLRKLAEFKTLDSQNTVDSLAFDHSGRYLAHASATRIQINVVKEWTTLCEIQVDDNIRALEFGVNAEFLAATTSEGLKLFGFSN